MPKYYVDFQHGADLFRDEEGLCCEFNQACLHATAALKEIGKDRLPQDNHQAVVATVRDVTDTVRYRATLVPYLERLRRAA